MVEGLGERETGEAGLADEAGGADSYIWFRNNLNPRFLVLLTPSTWIRSPSTTGPVCPIDPASSANAQAWQWGASGSPNGSRPSNCSLTRAGGRNGAAGFRPMAFPGGGIPGVELQWTSCGRRSLSALTTVKEPQFLWGNRTPHHLHGVTLGAISPTLSVIASFAISLP